MKPNQKLKAPDGFEIPLFPCPTLYMTSARDPDEHSVLALDFLPYNVNGQYESHMKCYAPFSGRIVYTGNDHNCILESDRPVHMPDGSFNYMRVLVAHSENEPVLYTHYNQGDLFYITGNYGQSTAEHLHMEVASVTDTSVQYWNNGGIGLYNAVHMWDGLFVNGTILLRPEDYPWDIYHGGIPGIIANRQFPWVLYSRKKRKKRNRLT